MDAEETSIRRLPPCTWHKSRFGSGVLISGTGGAPLGQIGIESRLDRITPRFFLRELSQGNYFLTYEQCSWPVLPARVGNLFEDCICSLESMKYKKKLGNMARKLNSSCAATQCDLNLYWG
jgi:hypothetical protein